MARPKSSAGTPATQALSKAGVAFTMHPYEHDPGTTAFGDEAARALGIDPARIFKTLVVDVGATKPILAVGVVPVADQLDLKAIAAALGAKKAVMADPAAAVRSSGYVVGGISPIAQKTALPTVIDSSAQGFPTIYVSAGRRGLQVELAAADLASLTGGRFARITK